ncbi:hypothetical protein A6R68_06275 [Neotoma lepida]|uniref:Uncharacterized protein n=1 Tax=Neotoma lepida TaxID=56216 RepID=A0A1A6GG33_NEOLE|nr:hypothetical protein A6R68_06275 [Neotoma lepida]
MTVSVSHCKLTRVPLVRTEPLHSGPQPRFPVSLAPATGDELKEPILQLEFRRLGRPRRAVMMGLLMLTAMVSSLFLLFILVFISVYFVSNPRPQPLSQNC